MSTHKWQESPFFVHPRRTRWEGMDRQEAKDARGLEEPAGELDAVASSVLQACVEVHRVVLFAPPSL